MKKKRGGQRKPAALRKRKSLTFRIRDQLRAQLEKAATAAERSVSEETEHRLMMSFAPTVFDDPAMRHVAILMAAAFRTNGELSSNGKPLAEWIKDPAVFRRATFGTFYSLARAIPDLTAEQVTAEIDLLKRELLHAVSGRPA